MKYYAKTYYENGARVGETIQEHTEKLLAGINCLKKYYKSEIEHFDKNIWEDLKIACLLHDLGKLSTAFQNKIRRALRLEPLKTHPRTNHLEVPHNYLSPTFLTGVPELSSDHQWERFLFLFYSIAFHHDRPLEFDEQTLRDAIDDISTRAIDLLVWIKSHIERYTLENFSALHYWQLKAYLDGNKPEINELKSKHYFVLLKGLLHRLDHSASAHLPVETSRLGDPLPRLEKYFWQRNSRLHPFQRDAVSYRSNSLILTASTGLGKTEFAINWIGDSKGFYTLPLKVSVNAMHQRLSKMFPSQTGIIHSDTYSLWYDNDQLSFENSIQRADIARQFGYPLVVTTADQLFTAVFKWPGYEKIYATLMYSKVILDEPQSYSPQTLAMIVRALEELTDYGSRFCYMSATQHPFVLEKLSKVAPKIGPFYHDELKHKLELRAENISTLKSEIVHRYQAGNKVLVIVNTVKKSQDLFQELKQEAKAGHVELLHAGFIKMHRDRKEESIQHEYKKENPVIWITTQIVEASLDIDYDVLFTEIATLDSLIQRMGRVFRRPGRVVLPKDAPNIIVACHDPSDRGHIYDSEIVRLTKDAIANFHERIISESDKQCLIDQVFSEERLRGTKFLRDYYAAYNLLKLGFQASSKKEAQRLFREINQVSAIPESVYRANERKIEDLLKIIQSKKDKQERIKANIELKQFLVSIPAYRNKSSFKLFERRSESIYVIPAKYSETLGLQYEEIQYMY